MNNWYKNKLIIAVAAILIIGGFFLFKGDGRSESEDSDEVTQSEQTPVLASDVKQGEMLVEGRIACLPYKAATAGQGCVKGIQGNDGKFYALNSVAVRNAENSMEVGTQVSSIGKFQAANTTVNDSSVFKYDGVLVVRVIAAK